MDGLAEADRRLTSPPEPASPERVCACFAERAGAASPIANSSTTNTTASRFIEPPCDDAGWRKRRRRSGRDSLMGKRGQQRTFGGIPLVGQIPYPLGELQSSQEIRGPVPDPWRQVSVPLPPFSESLPDPPYKVSLLHPPYRVSAPLLPYTMSAPPPPYTTSL